MPAKSRAFALGFVWPWASGTALLVLEGAILDARALASLLAVWAAFGIAGALLLGMPRSVVGGIVTLATGAMLGSLCVAGLGLVGVQVDPRLWPIAALVVGAVAALGRRVASVIWVAPLNPEPGGAESAPALGATVLFCLALLALPLLGVGRIIDGAHHFVAFFGADLFKHAANTGSLALGVLPPLDPFHAGERLQYYWLSYVAPASALAFAGPAARAINIVLGQTLLQGAALVVVTFALCRRLGASSTGAALAVGLGIASPSYDGLAAWLGAAGQPFLQLAQQRNMESLDLTRLVGAEEHFAASTLFRLCLYVPQHELAVVLVLCWLLLFDAPERPSSRLARAVLLLALPSVSVLVFAPAAAAVVCLLVATRFVSSRDERAGLNRLLVETTAALGAGFLGAEGWGAAGGGAALRGALISGEGASGTSPLWWLPQLVTSFGLMFVLGVIGGRTVARDGHVTTPQRFFPLALIAGGVGVLLAAEVVVPRGDFRMNLELKSSFVAGIGLVLGAASPLSRFVERPTWGGVALGALFLAPGLPSPVMDVVWHSTTPWDAAVRRPAHVAVPVADMVAFDWARGHTRARARFVQAPQATFLHGGVDTWVPVFAGRAVVAAPRASEPDPVYETLALALARARSGAEILRLAGELDAEYVYLSATLDPLGYARVRAILERRPEGLSLVYDSNGAMIISGVNTLLMRTGSRPIVEYVAVLAALLCVVFSVAPAFFKNLRASRLTEPMERLAFLASRATALAAGRPVEVAYPSSVTLTPSVVPRGELLVDPPGTWDHPTWRWLGFRFEEPHAYSYAFTSENGPDRSTFRATANGDLDGDGNLSTFVISGESARGGALRTDPIAMQREVE